MAGDYSTKNYTIENIYEPGYSSFKMSEGSHYLGKKNLIPASQLGITGDPRTANQLQELSSKLNAGTIPIELGTIDMPTFDTIPKQHFEEMRRKAKLAGGKVTLHAPIQDMDPSGFGQQGWEESKQKLVENQLKDVIDKAAMISPDGNMPITIHGSNTSASTFKMVDGKKQTEVLVAVDKAQGKLIPLPESKQFHPFDDLNEAGIMTPEDAMESHNRTTWRKEVDGILFEKETADRILAENYPIAKEIYSRIKGPEGNKIFNALTPTQKEMVLNLQTADAHIHQAKLSADTIFDKAFQYGGEDDEDKRRRRDELREIAKEFDKQMHGGYTQKDYIEIREKLEKNKGNISKKDEEKLMVIQHSMMDLQNQSHAIQDFAEKLREYNPNMLQSIESFTKEKASETFANVAMHSFKEHGEGAPVVSIENLYQGMGFSQGSDLRELVEKSQKKFIEKAIEEGNSRAKAEKIAKKLIGVTFDVGHLNLSRGHGFKEEDLVKEAKEIANHVKHVHITDNFGYSDSHLPIGMGNVPVAALLEALGDKGKVASKINEVGGWFQHFKTNPFNQILEATGSNVYSTGEGPYWSQAGGFQQGYMEGYGMMLPQINYETFGSGFSQLPKELGGQRGQTGGRMGGGF